MRFVVVGALSGAGKNQVANILEDIGYYRAENLPGRLLPTFAHLCRPGGKYENVALVTDVRAGTEELLEGLQHLRAEGTPYTVLFVEAPPEVILRRYKETRRRHPLAEQSAPLEELLGRERELMAPLRDIADTVLDPSALSAQELRERLCRAFAPSGEAPPMDVCVMSFGFKYGLPASADLVFDARFLPNPHYVEELRPQTGLDPAVNAYVKSWPQTEEFLRKLRDLLRFLLPRYADEGKTSLTVCVGCTGGKHRSVALAEELRGFMTGLGYEAHTAHRDKDR
jgi:UPF0042 nucleotide-binding protein